MNSMVEHQGGRREITENEVDELMMRKADACRGSIDIT